jgi:hypothetical protein
MSVKTRFKLILLCIAICCLSLIAGCSIGQPTADEFLDGKNATNQVVTYYANGGKFGADSDKVEKNLYYKENSPVVSNFATTSAKIQLTRDHYKFDAWYYVKLNADGEPELDESGNIQITDTLVDFTKKIQANEHWYICAGWIADVKVEVKLITSDGSDITVAASGEEEEDKVYKNGETAVERNFGTNNKVVLSYNAPIATGKDYTFVMYYYDTELTIPASGTINKPDDDSQNIVVYAYYIVGDWNIVRTASDANKMLGSLTKGGNYYLASSSSTKTFDMRSYSYNFSYGQECKITIEGNGYTLENLKFVGSGMNNPTYSMLGTLSSNTTINNLTFKNVTLSATLSISIDKLYGVFNGVTSRGNLNNFKIEGLTMTVKAPSGTIIGNFTNVDAEGNKTNWLFGGYDTDAAFLADYTDVTVTDATLIMQ